MIVSSSKAIESQNNTSKLPQDVWIVICKYLSARDIAALGCANRFFKGMMAEGSFSNYFLSRAESTGVTGVLPIRVLLHPEGFQYIEEDCAIGSGSWPAYVLPHVRIWKNKVERHGVKLAAFIALLSCLKHSRHLVQRIRSRLGKGRVAALVPVWEGSKLNCSKLAFARDMLTPFIAERSVSWLLNKIGSRLEQQIKQNYQDSAQELQSAADKDIPFSYLGSVMGVSTSLINHCLHGDLVLAGLLGWSVYQWYNWRDQDVWGADSHQISFFRKKISELIDSRFKQDSIRNGYKCYITGNVVEEWCQSKDGFLDPNIDEAKSLFTMPDNCRKLAFLYIKLKICRQFGKNLQTVDQVSPFLMTAYKDKHKELKEQANKQLKSSLSSLNTCFMVYDVTEQSKAMRCKMIQEIESCRSGDKVVQFTSYVKLNEILISDFIGTKMAKQAGKTWQPPY